MSGSLTQQALELACAPWSAPGRDGKRRERFVVLGDPQAPLEHLFSILEAQNLLGDDGQIRPDVGLISMGDHFDFRLPSEEPEVVRAASNGGAAFLRWLASHPEDQVFLLAGNHDLARVMELARETDASWSEAGALAVSYGKRASPDQCAAFNRAFPNIPTASVVRNDYATFSEAQRRLVQALLLSGRMRLALEGRAPDGVEVLLTHAGVTMRELELLELPPSPAPRVVAEALNARLSTAIESVREAWGREERVPLSLHPLNVTGTAGSEGGGLMNHRPAHPEAPRLDHHWAWSEASPRRFHPARLPRGLTQVVGHTGNRLAVRDLHVWGGGLPESPLPLRTLSVSDAVSYLEGLRPPARGAATLWMVDATFSEVPADAVELMQLDVVSA